MTSAVATSVRQVLLIAAHGSSTDLRAREQVLAHAARIAAMVPHALTVTGFARGTPSIADAIREAAASHSHNAARTLVTVLPFMTSAGHFATQVLPGMLREALQSTGDKHVSVVTTRALGGSRRITAVLHRRALRLAARNGWAARDVAVVLVGHGTRRHAASRETTLAHSRVLSTRGWGAVQAAFIDDDPGIADVVNALSQRRVIIVPFLIGGGSHHLIDIPQALGFEPIAADIDAPATAIIDAAGRELVLDAPLGSDSGLAEIGASIAMRSFERNVARHDAMGTRGRRGSVHLVGAGPGAADLITLRGQRALRRADVVLYDRLVSPAILAMARPDARLIDVGKQADTPQRSQEAINEALVAEAHAGFRVVRLKGGDPFVFGRGSEEMEACIAAGVSVFITPGISSALAAPAAAGIPVTARMISRGFAVVTASTETSDGESVAHIAQFALADTLVVLMGRARLRAICALMLDAGRDGETPVACIERATLPDQRVVRGTLRTIGDLADAAQIVAPMVIVIGATAAGLPLHAVAALHAAGRVEQAGENLGG